MRLIRFTASGVHGFLKFNIKFSEQLTFLTGINGSGKTTALNAIVALVTPDLSALSQLQYQKIQLDLDNNGKKLSILAENKGNSVVLRAPRDGTPFEFSKYILDPDIPLSRQFESEAEHYRELTATHTDHLTLKLIASLPTPMFLGLDRRSQFDDELHRRRYMPPRQMLARRNVFSTSLARSLMHASNLAQDHYRDALISSGKIAEKLQQEMLLNLLTVSPEGPQPNFAPLSLPTKEDAKEIETLRRDLEALPQILHLPQQEVRRRVTPFLDGIIDYMNKLPRNADISEIVEKSQGDSAELNALLGWSFNQVHLKRIKTISKIVSSYNHSRAEILEPTSKYLTLVNRFLKDSGTSVSFNDRGVISISIEGVNDQKPIDSLSSGEAQMFVILTHLAFNPLAQENNVFIIDEPELSLHVQWQELFVDSVISANPNIQYVLATHSPSIILDRIENCVELGRKRPKSSKAR